MAFDHRGDSGCYMSVPLGLLKKVADLQRGSRIPTRGRDPNLGESTGVQPLMRISWGATFARWPAVVSVGPCSRRTGRRWGNRIPPPVHIEQVIADGTAYPSLAALRLHH